MKKCTDCGDEKEYSEFHRQASRSDGYANWCKPCKSVRKRDAYNANRAPTLARMAAYREANKEKVAAGKRSCYLNNLAHYKAKHRAHYERNGAVIRKRSADYRRSNWPTVLAKNTKYKRERLRADPLYRAQYSMRCRLYQAFRKQGYAKSGSTRDMLGCDWPELMQHMASQFAPGMTMDNYGEWHVDHIIPISSAKDEAEMVALCHYSNLQPLWAADNIRKGSRLAA